ncbi:MAG TPA: hypothetical protein VGP22_11750 [Albitalea sp.]|jgi:hypothetical protein|nr:hypothetical protein [Albitalea sp.]
MPCLRKLHLAFSLIAVLTCGSAVAQSITLSPAVVPLEGHHGQGVTQILTLRNDSDIPLAFTLEARDVVVRDGTRVFLEAGELPDSAAASAVFTPKAVHIGAHSMASVTVTLTVPPTMRHRAVVAYFRGTDLLPAGGRKARMSLGTLLTFALSDRVSVRVDALDAQPPSASANAALRATLVNDGDEPVVPTGMVVVLDMQGRMVGKVPFPARRLLPGESTTLVADYPGELGAGSYRAIVTFDVQGRALTRAASLEVR